MVELASEAEAVAKQVGIPAQPAVVMAVYKEIRKPEPSFRTIADLVARDASLSARVIKVINSPFYGRPMRIVSIQQAVTMLGLQNFFKVVLTATLREVLATGGQNKKFEGMWRHTVAVARVAEFVATWMGATVSPEDAYMAGLFHDCAMPVLIKKFKGEQVYFGQKHRGAELIDAEDQAFGTNHAVIGGIMARSWGMAPEIAAAIKNHHVQSVVDLGDRKVGSLWFILRLSDYLGDYLLWKRGVGDTEFDSGIFLETDKVAAIGFDEATLRDVGVDGEMVGDLVGDAADLIDVSAGDG